MRPIPQRIAEELSVRPEQVIATIEMLNEGSTVPFIARYRKEKTGGLDDTQLRTLEERLRYLTELEERRASVLESIREQEKLTPELEAQINEADTKTRLEDLYLPYKKKRRTKAQIAREAGWSHFPRTCLTIRRLTRKPRRQNLLMPKRALKTPRRPLMGRARF